LDISKKVFTFASRYTTLYIDNDEKQPIAFDFRCSPRGFQYRPQAFQRIRSDLFFDFLSPPSHFRGFRNNFGRRLENFHWIPKQICGMPGKVQEFANDFQGASIGFREFSSVF
jgi:hypothetical protein